MTSTLSHHAGKELILDVACRLFMQEGFEGVSMQQIATATHMTKGAPYHHFKGKEDLFIQAFGRYMTKIHQGLLVVLAESPTFRDQLIAGTAYLFATSDAGVVRLFDDLKRITANGCLSATDDEMPTPEVMVETWSNVFAAAASEGVTFRLAWEKVAYSFMALQLGRLQMQTTLQATASTSPETARQVATEMVDLFLSGAIAQN